MPSEEDQGIEVGVSPSDLKNAELPSYKTVNESDEEQSFDKPDMSKVDSVEVGSFMLTRSETEKYLMNNPIANKISNPMILSVFLFLNAMIGSGIFNMPYVFFQAGILGALIIFIPATYFTWVGLVTLTDACVEVNTPEFEGTARKAFGFWGEWCVNLCFLFYTFGAELSYFLLLGEVISQLLTQWGCHGVGCNQYMSTWYAMMIMLPISQMRHLGNLAYLSVYSMVTIAAIIGLTVIGGPLTNQAYRSENLWVINGYGMLVSGIGAIVFALCCSPQTLHIYMASNANGQKPGNWSLICMWAVFAGLIMCVFMGLAGYLSFRDSTNSFILNNFTQKWADIFLVMFVIHLIFFTPSEIMVMRYNFCKVAFNRRSEDLDWRLNRVVTFFMVACVVGTVMGIIASGQTNGIAFSLVLNITGGVAASWVSFVLPGAMYLKLIPREKQKYRIASIANIAFGLAVTIIVVATLIATPFVPALQPPSDDGSSSS